MFKSSMIVAMAIFLSFYRDPKLLVNKKSKNKLIIFHKMGGFEDIEEAYKINNATFDILFIRREYLKRISKAFFSAEVSDMNYLSESTEVEREEYKNFLIKVFSLILKVSNIKAILTFNLVYYAERELPFVFSSLGIKSIILQKEGLRPSISWQKMVDIYKKQLQPFLGYKILTYNDATKKCLTLSGISNSKDIEIIGMPRLDFCHKIRKIKKVRKNVIFYMIDKKAGLCNNLDSNGKITEMRYEDDKGNVIFWDNLIKRTNIAVMDSAKANPNLQFILKGKASYKYYQETHKLLSQNLPDNVRIATGATGHYLLQEASVIIGFNTTAIFEGIASGVPVIVPLLFSSEPEEMKKFILDTNSAVFYAETEGELSKLIYELGYKENASSLTHNVKTVLKSCMGNSDGKSSERLRIVLEQAMN